MAIEAPGLTLPTDRKVEGLATRLETAFDEIAESWLKLGSDLSCEPSAELAHAPACAANVCDLGVMMAWSNIVRWFAGRSETTLVVCDDPWVFRHLSGLDRVDASNPPALVGRRLKYWARGLISRCRVAFRVARDHIRVRHHKSAAQKGGTALLVYGHPGSTATGKDAYFSDLLCHLPTAQRLLHVDCNSVRAEQLRGNNQTLSLHAWGHLKSVFSLPFARWKPLPLTLRGEWGWLVRRAAALEGGTGQGAMIRWQQICQTRWLQETRPEVVSWPWENHGWERAFVRTARTVGVRTVAYQHSVVGRQMLNYSPKSNGDGLGSVPDSVLCTGPATLDQLANWGIPGDRLALGGALRFPDVAQLSPDPGGPVYLALSFDKQTSEQMLAAAERLTDKGFHFVFKHHPMQPLVQSNNPLITRTDKMFFECPGLRALIYAASTVGIESALAGIPTLRFQVEDKIALDILPENMPLPASDADGLEAALKNIRPPRFDRQQYFSPVDLEFWKRTLSS